MAGVPPPDGGTSQGSVPLDRFGHFLLQHAGHGLGGDADPRLLWLHVTADALIALSYFTIPFTLLYFIRRRRDLPFNWVFVCFATFIVACGLTHVMGVWTTWIPSWWTSGAIKVVTAVASIGTAVALVHLMPVAIRLPSPARSHARSRNGAGPRPS